MLLLMQQTTGDRSNILFEERVKLAKFAHFLFALRRRCLEDFDNNGQWLKVLALKLWWTLACVRSRRNQLRNVV